MVTKTPSITLAEKRSVSFEVVGIANGWKGLVEVDTGRSENCGRHLIPLDQEIVRTWTGMAELIWEVHVQTLQSKNDRSEQVVDISKNSESMWLWPSEEKTRRRRL
jgi:6-phosphofructokinase 1